MHNCPHCHQNLNAFAFYCPRCKRPTGELGVEGDMLAVWWLNAGGAPDKKWCVKTLKSGADYLNLVNVSPLRPAAPTRQTTITFMARLGTELPQRFEKSAVEVFEEMSRPEMQEWQIR